MMDSVPELLRECSSFYNNNESDPWELHFPVIPSINGETFTTICSILSNCKHNPSQNTGIIIFGEAGYGKTHMIGRIRKECESTNISAFFSNIRPIIDDKVPMRHLLKGIITSLAHDIEGSQGFTQIHKLISEIILDYYQVKLKNKPNELKKLIKVQNDKYFFFKIYKEKRSRSDILKKQVIDWIIKKNLSIDPSFLTLLFSFCNPHLRNIAFQRIFGNIADKDDANKLGIPFSENISENAHEDEARDFVISLGQLLANYQHILVVCFDQLENMHEKGQIKAFGDMILTLINECKAMVPLTMSRTLHWEKVIEPVLDKSVVDRIKGNNFSLYGCSEDEIKEILRSRIQSCIQNDWEKSYHWLFSRVKTRLNPSPSPRDVITTANRIIRQNEPIEHEKGIEIAHYSTPNDIIETAYHNERDQILSDMSSWPPDYEEITEAVTLFLESRKIRCKKDKKLRKTILHVEDKNGRCCIIINTNPNHSTIGSCFSTGTEYLKRNPETPCIYLTDPRCIVTKPRWVQANNKKEAFLTAGGKIMKPTDGDIARYYALYSLNCKVTEGDLLIETEDGVRSISKDELIAFIGNKDLFLSPLKPSSDTLPEEGRGKKKIPDEIIHQAVCDIINQAPMHIMKSLTISKELNSRDIPLTHDDLLVWCGEHKDSYVIFRSPQGSTIMLKGLTICTA